MHIPLKACVLVQVLARVTDTTAHKAPMLSRRVKASLQRGREDTPETAALSRHVLSQCGKNTEEPSSLCAEMRRRAAAAWIS